VFGILAEKAELLSGSPTARLQTIGAPPAVEVVEYLNWLRSEYARRTGLGGGKEGQRVIEAAAADPALAAAGVDQGPAEIVEPGACGVADPALAADPAPDCSVGQTTHRQDDKAVNIEPNEGAQNGDGPAIPGASEISKASV
jgi:hypothetical protein